jgi:hypothetical protein
MKTNARGVSEGKAFVNKILKKKWQARELQIHK